MTDVVRAAFLIAANDLRRLVRLRQTLLWVFLMPPLFFYFVGTATSGGRAGLGPARRPSAVVLHVPAGERGDALADAVQGWLEADGFDVSRPAPGGRPARDATHVHLPEPVEVGPGGPPASTAVTYRFRTAASPGQARLVERSLARVLGEKRLALEALERRGLAPDASTLREVADAGLSLREVVLDDARAVPDGFAQAIPGILVMFTMLLLLATGAAQVVVERELGLLRRLASTPMPRAGVVLGKWLGLVALAGLQLLAALAVAGAFFDTRFGAALPMVALLLLAWAAFNASLAVYFATIARTNAQASAIGISCTMLLAALGGCWWPVEVSPPWMQTLAAALPSRWTMAAFHDLTTHGLPPQGAWPAIAGLLSVAAVFAYAASRRWRYA